MFSYFRNTIINHLGGFYYIYRRIKVKTQHLIFLVLKNIHLSELKNYPSYFLLLLSYYAKLHKIKRIKEMLPYIPNNVKGSIAVGDILAKAGRFKESLFFYQLDLHQDDETLLKMAYSYIKCKNFNRASQCLSKVKGKCDYYYKYLYLECLKNLEPENDEIKKIDDELLTLEVVNAKKLKQNQYFKVPNLHGTFKG